MDCLHTHATTQKRGIGRPSSRRRGLLIIPSGVEPLRWLSLNVRSTRMLQKDRRGDLNNLCSSVYSICFSISIAMMISCSAGDDHDHDGGRTSRRTK